MVCNALGLAKITTPGPLALLQPIVNTEPKGRPSSLAEPLSVAVPGSVTVLSGPALTTGG